MNSGSFALLRLFDAYSGVQPNGPSTGSTTGIARMRSRLIVWGALLTSAYVHLSCRTGQENTAPSMLYHIDRLVATYPELRAGRFALLADFESPTHFELFHAVDDSGSSLIESTRAAQPSGSTGYALRWSASASSNGLLVNNDHATNWYLKRDWSAYDLLMFSVEAPRSHIRLGIEISAGAHPNVTTARTTWTLSQGRNVVRLDLAELGERIALDDVRQIKLHLPDVNDPPTLTLDDFLLTQDRESIMGDREATDASLFVFRQGRRWHVGAGGRFELAFANGQIIGWFDRTRDPQRLENLVQGTVLGPDWLDDDATAGDRPREAAALVSTQTELLEANAVRVVIRTEQTVSDTRSQPPRPTSVNRWHYTVYPTGQIFVSARRGSSGGSHGMPIALVVSTGQPTTAVPMSRPIGGSTESELSDSEGYAPGALMRVGRHGAPLLFVPYFGSGGITWHERRSGDVILSVVASSNEPTIEGATSTCAAVYLRLGGSEVFDASDALREAMWFRRAEELTPSVGTLTSSDDPCDFHGGGFNRTSGAYVYSPKENLVRVRSPDHSTGNPTPAFEISAVEGMNAWVYLGHRIHEPTAISPEGFLLFQLPRDLQPAEIIEVQLAGPEN